jgi:hypothetical protein
MTGSRFHHRSTTQAPPSKPSGRQGRRPGALVVATLVTLLMASPALPVLRTGTSGPDELIGTKGTDHITGAEGPDILVGKAGNDTYSFADNWGTDFLVEKPGEGTDTLNFRGVHTGGINVQLLREWHAAFPSLFPRATGQGGAITLSTDLGVAVIEKVIGGQGDGDLIIGGGGPNTLMPGGGANDALQDYAGWNDGPGNSPEIPASNDTYKGFAGNTGATRISDWGAAMSWTCAPSRPRTSTSVGAISTPTGPMRVSRLS